MLYLNAICNLLIEQAEHFISQGLFNDTDSDNQGFINSFLIREQCVKHVILTF